VLPYVQALIQGEVFHTFKLQVMSIDSHSLNNQVSRNLEQSGLAKMLQGPGFVIQCAKASTPFIKHSPQFVQL
jgi:hypothetical protein